ncbi:membrane-bound metal-dependent hydrolase [Salinarchaeum sp. Harcht-Bsk1]|uniref:metal-dependent hydrolase n=1 Tax=Salinarchaeum sp. Harcht-Bsk1 TaxID=1333523 RepID=UPI0003423FDB|nr:metal-dependent hydrolase [Salinarchaeum sp. Harcht-Bsk1]AGN02201.1 membrane-bound metal-dependent hydrolase [Salinarchaeum sp. Harcht-Bsk1]
MWPWEHVAAAYLGYSLFARIVYRRAPRGDAVLAVTIAALLPDLIDKPLAWGLHLLPSGRSLAHSLLFAVPAMALSALLTGRRVALAFALGYCSHLAGDVVYPMALEQPAAYRFLLWPLVEQPTTDTPGLLFRVQHLFVEFLGFLQTTRGRLYVVFEGALLGTAVLLWLLDGRPGPGTIWSWMRPGREKPRGT